MRKITCSICGKKYKPSKIWGHKHGYICPKCGREYCRSCAKVNDFKCQDDNEKLAKIRS